MERVKAAKLSAAREYFTAELKTVMEKQHVSARPGSFEYIVDLMVRYLESENFFVKGPEGKLQQNVLADLYAEYRQGTPEARKLTLQRLGDICLLISGFFADSLKRKLVDLDYYLGMGGSAYWKLSHLTSAQGLYRELALKIKPFSDVLGEMSERSGLQTNSDLLRLYERWLFTGSERLKTVLSEHGITPIKIKTKTKQ